MENSAEKTLPDLAAIRKHQVEIYTGVYKDPKEVEGHVAWKVFVLAEPEQITQELVN